MSFFSSAARRLVPFCSAFIQIVQVFLRISAVFLPSNCNFSMQSVFTKSCIFCRTQCKLPAFSACGENPSCTHCILAQLPARWLWFVSWNLYLFRKMRQCYNTSINNRQVTEQSVLCLLSVLSARIPLFLFSEMKTHGGGCAIVRPGCHVFFFCLFIHSCIFPAVFVYFLFFTLTFFRIFDTIIPIYRGTTICLFGHRVEKVKTWPFEPVG